MTHFTLKINSTLLGKRHMLLDGTQLKVLQYYEERLYSDGARRSFLILSDEPGSWSSEKTDLEEKLEHAVSGKGGGEQYWDSWMGTWLVIALSLEHNNASGTRRHFTKSQCYGIHRPYFRDWDKLRPREVKGLLNPQRLIHTYILTM